MGGLAANDFLRPPCVRSVLSCPFCGARETDRFDLGGRRFVVFACMFTPEVDPAAAEAELAEHLSTAYRPDGSGAYFRQMCDRVHVYVAKGEGAQVLKGGRSSDEPPPP